MAVKTKKVVFFHGIEECTSTSPRNNQMCALYNFLIRKERFLRTGLAAFIPEIAYKFSDILQFIMQVKGSKNIETDLKNKFSAIKKKYPEWTFTISIQRNSFSSTFFWYRKIFAHVTWFLWSRSIPSNLWLRSLDSINIESWKHYEFSITRWHMEKMLLILQRNLCLSWILM